MTKKIIIIGSAHPLRGGIAAFNERLAKAFIEDGNDVEIFSFSLQYPGFLFPGKTQFSSDPAPENLKIHIRLNSINPINWISVGKEIARLKPDLIVVPFWLPFMGPCFGTILRKIRKNGHSKIVSVIHNMIPHEKRIGDKAFSRYFVKAVDAFIVMSKSVKEDIKLFAADKPCEFIPHPVYDNYGKILSPIESRKSLELDPEGKYILFFGFIREYKGLDLLLEDMSDERIKNLGIKAIIAGEFYSDSKPYEELIDKIGIRESLILHTDFIPNAEVAPYFGAADIVVQPYKTATQSGISQLAYHFEKPMLVTNVGGLPEIVAQGKAGYVVSPESSSIADAIVDFYINKRADEFQTFVKEEKKKYSWKNMVDGIKEISNI